MIEADDMKGRDVMIVVISNDGLIKGEGNQEGGVEAWETGERNRNYEEYKK